jgi:D-sedoheptulose 7-phosphate isomerase
MNRLERLYADHPDASEFSRGYLDYLGEIAALLDTAAIAAFVAELLAARERGGRIFFLGNGGSAATASHFVNDLLIGTKEWKRPFHAVCLSDNVPVVTAIANDDGYEEVFVQQLRAQVDPGDLVVAISVSGNSPNVVAAIELALDRGARTVALTGFDGGRLHELVHVEVHVPTEAGEYGPAEDVHMIIDHLIGSYLSQLCATERQTPTSAGGA